MAREKLIGLSKYELCDKLQLSVVCRKSIEICGYSELIESD